MKKVIGITGGVGSGKSTILNVLRDEFHAQLLLTDNIAKELMMPGTDVYKRLVAELGEDVLDEEGLFDKKKLADLLFGSREINQTVNSIVHPAVHEECKKRIAASKKQFVIVESALLIDAGFTDLCDEVWYVYASTQERVKRLYEQRGYSEVKSYGIIYNQLSHEEFLRNSNRLIDNGLSREYARHQVRTIMKELMEEA